MNNEWNENIEIEIENEINRAQKQNQNLIHWRQKYNMQLTETVNIIISKAKSKQWNGLSLNIEPNLPDKCVLQTQLHAVFDKFC